MKISNNSYPILDKLQHGILGILPFYEEDKKFIVNHTDIFSNRWKFYHKQFLTEINIISESFYNSAFKVKERLMSLFLDIINNDLHNFDISGTYIIDGNVYMIDYHAKKNSEEIEIVLYVFTKNGIPLTYFSVIDNHEIIQEEGWISNVYKINENDAESIKDVIYHIIGMIVLFKMFKTYAEVEIKILKPNTKNKFSKNKIINNTKLNIIYLDSKWFTTLIKSDAFKVSGHFRLQPYKNNKGDLDKRLIWISDFIKTGYTSKAKVENFIDTSINI